MCCFTQKTEVHGTTIFARRTSATGQALVYQMQFTASEPTAMILPLPVRLPAGESSIAWKSLKEYPDFFAALDAGFPAPVSRSPTAGLAKAALDFSPPIPVHEVGDFVASFVPTIPDFARLDPRFVIGADVWQHIPQYKDYGFAVFQLKELSGSPHPIAFEFESRMDGRLYFPTVHIHDGTFHAQDTFDHMLYLQDPRFDAKAGGYAGPTKADPGTGYVRSKDTASTFASPERSLGIVDGALLVHRTPMQGLFPNIDTIVSPHVGAAAVAMGCGRCDVTAGGAGDALFGPSGIALAGLSSIIRRRDERPAR